MAIAQQKSPHIRDVGVADFEQAVIAESRKRLVVVDFWAAWCGPCRTLGPVLERVVASYNGAVLLAKVDVDQNQQLAARYGVQGIPAVKAFRDGRVVKEFTGAQPEPQVRRFFQELAPAKAAAPQADEVEALVAAGKIDQAVGRYRELLAEQPEPAAVLGLARLLLPRDAAAVRADLAAVPSGSPAYPVAQQLLELVAFYQLAAAGRGSADGASAELDGRYRAAAAAARQSSWQQAFDELLAIIMRDRGYRDDGARKTLLALFTLLGDDNPLVPQYRKRLANALF